MASSTKKIMTSKTLKIRSDYQLLDTAITYYTYEFEFLIFEYDVFKMCFLNQILHINCATSVCIEFHAPHCNMIRVQLTKLTSSSQLQLLSSSCLQKQKSWSCIGVYLGQLFFAGLKRKPADVSMITKLCPFYVNVQIMHCPVYQLRVTYF